MDRKGRKVVALGLLGPTLDAGTGSERWEKWRPTVALCQHEDLVVDRLELLYQEKFSALARRVVSDLGRVSPETTVNLVEITLEDPWNLEEMYGVLHDFARGYPFKPEDEDYLVHITTGTHVAQICLFLLTESRYLPARLIQTAPPREKPGDRVGTYTVIDLDLSRYDRIASRFKQAQREGLSFLKSGIDTRNRAFNQLIERIERVALASRAPMLLMGPTGAGKSQLARRIYELKRARRQVTGAFVDVNCATLRGDTAMSTLFGHTKGAFTGAQGERAGLLRSADGGVLFLDEIGELGGDEQAMLLRALEEKTFLPVGSDREVKSDFQLLAGTNRDLVAQVESGRFREDLLARINLWTFRLPGLRERPEDLAPNLEYELERCSKELGTRVTFNREARELFLGYATSPEALWRGNFRDLNAAITRMATLAPGGRISVDVVEEELTRLRDAWRSTVAEAPAPVRRSEGVEATPRDRGVKPGAPSLHDGTAEDPLVAVLGDERVAALDRFDRAQLSEVVRVCLASPTLSAAGRALFATSRQRKTSSNDADRLRKYLARFGLSWAGLRA